MNEEENLGGLSVSVLNYILFHLAEGRFDVLCLEFFVCQLPLVGKVCLVSEVGLALVFDMPEGMSLLVYGNMMPPFYLTYINRLAPKAL